MIWPVALALAAVAPWIVRGVERLVERRVERRTKALLERARSLAASAKRNEGPPG